MSDGPIQNFSDFFQWWRYRSFDRTQSSSAPCASNPDSCNSTNDTKGLPWSDALRTLLYGQSRVEFTTVFRADGAMARQVVFSLGIQPLGRVATRMTLNPSSGWPTALHGEVILGPKPYSLGLSVGRSRDEVIINYFNRRQPSILTTNRELTRLIVGPSGAEVQRIGELKFYGRSLSTVEVGEAVSYQLHREHLREAYRLLESEGANGAASFLKRNYSFVDEALVRRAMLHPGVGALGLASEMSAYFFLGLGLSQIVPEGPLRHAAQSGSAYAVSNLFRGGLTSLRPSRLGLAIAEGVPVAMIHGLISTGFDAMGFQWKQRWLLEDFGSLALYGRLKSFLYLPNRGLSARGLLGADLAVDTLALGQELWTARRFLRFGSGLAMGALLLGGVYWLATHSNAPEIDFAEIEARYGDSERQRLGISTAEQNPASLSHFSDRPDHSYAARAAVLREIRREQRKSAIILARLLDGSDARRPLSGPLESGEVTTLAEAVSNLSVAQQNSLRTRLRADTIAALFCIERESNREIFYQSLYILSGDVEEREQDRDLVAGILYILQMQGDAPALRPMSSPKLNEMLQEGATLQPQAFFSAPRAHF